MAGELFLASQNLHLDAAFFASVLGIILIDLVLAGDNAVVIAMAVRNLPPAHRKRGILLGAGAAVALRIVATFFVAQLLNIGLIKLAGGAAVLWIGTKLFVDGMPDEQKEAPAKTMWQAVRLIVIADITLSIDNMLAVGGASHGNFFLLLFGLAVSVPFVVLTSNVLSLLMDRYPVIIAIGAAVLGKVGSDMIATDPFVSRMFPLGGVAHYAVQAVGAVGVLLVGGLIMRRSSATEETGSEVDIAVPELADGDLEIAGIGDGRVEADLD
jgi:YjbE family integral membrane protein